MSPKFVTPKGLSIGPVWSESKFHTKPSALRADFCAIAGVITSIMAFKCFHLRRVPVYKCPEGLQRVYPDGICYTAAAPIDIKITRENFGQVLNQLKNQSLLLMLYIRTIRCT